MRLDYTTDLNEVTLLKRFLYENKGDFSDMKPEEFDYSAMRLCKLLFYSLTIQHLL